jgi:transcriptional regulator with XRE-family HTH domain
VQGETISRIERGLHMPPLKKLHELCRAMRVSLAQLITEAERSERGQRSERSERGEGLLQELLMDLDAADREFVLETAARCARHLRRPR